MVGFIFGSKDKDKPWSYEELQRKREIAETLAASNLRTPQNVGEGLASIGRALMYRKLDKKAAAEEGRLRDEFNAKWSTAFGGGGAGVAARGGYGGGSPSGTWTPDAPPPSPVDVATQGMDVAKSGGLTFGADKPKADPGVMGAQGGLDFGAAVMTPQEMLIEGAKARGLDPIDVATAISYETGGKFDPLIKGPTTQWGTHEGLIQFGDPQGQQHGAVFDQGADAAWRSQLNPDSGAVWSYLDSTGVKPGMGLPEIYSAINAGAVGRMGASDANNGGAPGTVADKVASMGPHREKAAQFLGGTWTPDPNAPQGGSQGMAFADASGGFGGGFDIGSLVGLASDPMASPAQKAIVETLIQQQLQAADPLRAIQLERERLELEALKDPKPGFTMIPAQEAQALGLPEGGVYQRGPNGEIDIVVPPPKPDEGDKPPTSVAEYEYYRQGAIARGEVPMAYEEFLVSDEKASIPPGSPQVGTIPQGYQLVQGADGAYSMQPIPGGPEDTTKTDAAKASGTATASDIITTAASRALDANSERVLGGLAGALASYNPGTPNAEVYRQTEVLKANAKVENLQAMRNESPTGGALGSVTEGETKMLADQAGALDPASPNYERDVKDYTRNLLRVIHGKDAGDAIFDQQFGGQTASGGVPQGIDPADWEFMTPEERALFQ